MMAWIRSAMARLEIATSGYFDAIGWFRTRATRRAVDGGGEPIPWFTYPAIAFLEQRIRPEWRVLEFGSGMGTAWWSRRVGAHVALEHDAAWAARVAGTGSATVIATSDADAAAYTGPALELGPFDVVIVDGLFRNECLAIAPGLLAPAGIIILDDSQRAEYAPAVASVRGNGFRQISFHGPQPVSKHAGCTSVFYRPVNVLDL